MATESAQTSGRINVKEIIDNRVIPCIAYVVRFVFGGTFLGITVMLIGTQLNGTPGDVAALVGSGWAGVMFKRRGWFSTMLAAALAFAAFIGAEFAIRGLATMATNGVYGPDQSGLTYFYAGNYLLFGVLWLIFGIPYRAFRYEIDKDGGGSSQDVVTTSLAVIAALLTGAFVLLLHGGKGPFSQVDTKALIVGDIFTVFLIVPIYRSVAKACWQRGIIGILSPRSFLARWREAAIEIEATSLEYYIELYSRERKAKLPSGSNSGGEATRRKKPQDRASVPEASLPSRMEPGEAERERNSTNVHSSRSKYGRGGGRPYRANNSQKRRKKRPKR